MSHCKAKKYQFRLLESVRLSLCPFVFICSLILNEEWFLQESFMFLYQLQNTQPTRLSVFFLFNSCVT